MLQDTVEENPYAAQRPPCEASVCLDGQGLHEFIKALTDT